MFVIFYSFFLSNIRFSQNAIYLSLSAYFIAVTRAHEFITKTYLYNFDPLKPHFFTVKLGFTGV